MISKIYTIALTLIILGISTPCLPAMIDLQEELLDKSESEPMMVIQSANLSDTQKQAIQGALNTIFSSQIQSTALYGEIVAALSAAFASPEVAAAGKRFIAELNTLLRVFFKNVKLSGDQVAKLRDMLETIKALATIQISYLPPKTIDEAVQSRVIALQERLSAHLAPMTAGMQSVLTQDQLNVYQKEILELLINLIKDALLLLPEGTKTAGAGNPPPLAEPDMPEFIAVSEDELG